MLVRQAGWGGFVALMLGLGLFANGGNTVAQAAAAPGYVGAYMCSGCHAEEYASWSMHGHAWMQVHTGGKVPPADLFAPVGVELPATLPIIKRSGADNQLQWVRCAGHFWAFQGWRGRLASDRWNLHWHPPGDTHAHDEGDAGPVQQVPQYRRCGAKSDSVHWPVRWKYQPFI